MAHYWQSIGSVGSLLVALDCTYSHSYAVHPSCRHQQEKHKDKEGSDDDDDDDGEGDDEEDEDGDEGRDDDDEDSDEGEDGHDDNDDDGREARDAVRLPGQRWTTELYGVATLARESVAGWNCVWPDGGDEREWYIPAAELLSQIVDAPDE